MSDLVVEDLICYTAGRTYEADIEAALERHEASAAEAGRPARLAACIIEPLLQGAGGMVFVDPAFQRALVRISRSNTLADYRGKNLVGTQCTRFLQTSNLLDHCNLSRAGP